jgi:uncharacterized protein YukE
VSDEYVARYQGLSHQQLWTQLKSGDPGQVDTLAAAWKSLHDTADSLANTLTSDLAKLTTGWNSSSGSEYQRRLGLISDFSTTMAGEFSTLHQNLTIMASELRTAQKQAEDPAATDNNDNLVKDAAIGFAVAGPVGGVVGGFFGHDQDEQEKEKARQRMVQLVAGLAADYVVTTGGEWDQSVPIPDDLPGEDTTGGTYTPRSGPGGTGVGSVGGLNSGTPIYRTVDDPSRPSQGPTSGSGAPGDSTLGPDGKPIDPATGLAGADELAGAGLLGVGGLAASVLGASGGGLGPSGLGTAFGPGGGLAGATGPGNASGLGGSAGGAGEPHSAAGSRLAGRQAASGSGRGEGGDDEPDERMTWLTEDDMVWGAEAAPPSLLGERPAEDPHAAE